MFEISERGPGWVPSPTIYVPLVPTQSTIQMTVRVREDPARFIPRLGAIAAGIDPTLVLHQLRPLERLDPITRSSYVSTASASGFSCSPSSCFRRRVSIP
jgi:hypothetical protein